jgi:hypothetical protein
MNTGVCQPARDSAERRPADWGGAAAVRVETLNAESGRRRDDLA